MQLYGYGQLDARARRVSTSPELFAEADKAMEKVFQQISHHCKYEEVGSTLSLHMNASQLEGISGTSTSCIL